MFESRFNFKALPKRIVVFGNGGTGKTTFTDNVGRKLKIPILHLDKIYWKNGWEHYSEEYWLEHLHARMVEPSWIIEGTQLKDLEERIALADLVIFMNDNPLKCIYRITKRSWRDKFLKLTPHDGCPVKLISLIAIKWLWNYNKNKLPEVNALLAKFPDKKIVRLYGFRSINKFRDSLTEAIGVSGRECVN